MSTAPNRFDTLLLREGLYPSLLHAGLIDHNGSVSKKKSIDPHFDDLEEEEQQAIEHEYKLPHSMISRGSHKLGMVSPIEVATATDAVALSVVGSKIKSRLLGGKLRELAAQTIRRIFKTLSGHEVPPTAFVKQVPRDRDWSFLLEDCRDQTLWEKVMQKGPISLVMKKVEDAQLDRCDLAESVALAHQKALQAPPGTYPYQTAENQGETICITDPELVKKFAQLCAFEKATDICEPSLSKYHFLRRIGYEKGIPSDDFGFTNEAMIPARPIDSLYVELESPSEKRRLKLASTLGKEGLIQAVFDLALNNMTFSHEQDASPRDFARTMLFFAEGGTCFQVGWLEKSFNELCTHATKIQTPWPQLLATQLISIAQNHCCKKLEILVALAFNACAILTWKQFASTSEIHDIWKVLFWHMDKTSPKKEFSEQDSNNLIESIKMCLRGDDCRFEDVYFQIQASSMICLNRARDVSPCSLSMTEHHPFIRIHNLFFPCDLARAVDHLATLQTVTYLPNNKRASITLNMLGNVHSSLCEKEISSSDVRKSLFASLAEDPRFKRERVLEKIKLLSQEVYTWSSALCIQIANQSSKNTSKQQETKDFVSTFRPLAPEQKQASQLSEEFCKYSFASAIEAMKSQPVQLACAYFSELQQPDTYTDEWLEVFELLLQKREWSELFTFLDEDKRIVPPLQHNQEKIDACIVALKTGAASLLGFEDDKSKTHLEQLLRLMYQFLSTDHYKGAQIWIEYVELLVEGSPLHQAEEFFVSMMKDKSLFKRIPEWEARVISFWIPLFTRFGEAGSKILLKTDLWKEYVDEEIALGMPVNQISKLYSSIAKGAVTALKTMNRSSEKKELVEDVLLVLSAEYCVPEVMGTRGAFFLDLAELEVMHEEKKTLLHACLELQAVFWLSSPSALVESRAVQLSASVVIKMMDSIDPQCINQVLMLIDLVQRSAFQSKANHFASLEFVMKHRNFYKDNPQIAARSACADPTLFLFNIISSLLKSILAPTNGRIQNTIPEKQIHLATQAFQFIDAHADSAPEFLSWSVKQPSFCRYVRERVRDKIVQKANSVKRPDQFTLQLNQVTRDFALLKVTAMRVVAAQAFGLQYRAELLPAERRAIRSLLGEALPSLCVRTTVAAFIVFGFFYWLSCVVEENGQRSR